MKYLALIITFTLFSPTASAVDKDLLLVRELYYRAASDKEQADVFSHFLLSSPALQKTTLAAYQGMSYMLKANYSYNPYSKLNFFNKGKKLLDNAIKESPDDIELRFLRFCVQTNAPGFLGYSGDIEEDKTVILKWFSYSSDKDLKERIKKYLTGSKYCSATDKNQLQ